MKSPTSKTARQLVVLVLMITALACVVGTLVFRVPRMMPLNYVEGFNLLDALRVAAGGELYGDPAERPWTLHVYTPLYTYVHSLLVDPSVPSLVTGRLVSYLALVLGAVAVAVMSAGASRPWSAGIAALYVTMPLLASWGALVRPDNLAVLFSLLGVLIVARCERRGWVLLAAVCFFLAFLSKQSTVAGFLASTLYLATRNRRATVLLAGASVALGGGAVIWLQAYTQGWFLFHTVTGNLNPFEWQQFWSIQGEFVRDHSYLVIAGLVLSGSAIRHRRLSLPFLWFLAAAALAIVSVGKVGSDGNYFLEPLAALTLFAVAEIPEALSRLTETRRRTVSQVLCYLGLLAAVVNVSAFYRQSVNLPAADAAYSDLVRDVRALPSGPLISDDGALLAYSGRQLVLRPFVMAQLANAGRWNETPVLQAIESREFRAIIPVVRPEGHFASRYTPAMRQAVADHYRPAWTFHLVDLFQVFVPLD